VNIAKPTETEIFNVLLKAFWQIKVPRIFYASPHVTFRNSTSCPHSVFTCFVWTWEQTATCATYSINWLVFITEMKSVYSAVRTVSLNKFYWLRDAPTV
jgi:hypothetical protein